jgi:hypothetical protein
MIFVECFANDLAIIEEVLGVNSDGLITIWFPLLQKPEDRELIDKDNSMGQLLKPCHKALYKYNLGKENLWWKVKHLFVSTTTSFFFCAF